MTEVAEPDISMPITDLGLERAVMAEDTLQIDLVTLGPADSAKAAVVELAFTDSAGARVEVPDWPHHSDLFGEYLYLRAKQDQPRRTTFLVTVPKNAVKVRLTGHTWSDYSGLQLLAPPRITRLHDVVSTVNAPIGGEITSGIALAAVHARHHVPFDIETVQVEIPVQGNLRPAQQMLHLSFYTEEDAALSIPQGSDNDPTIVEISVESHSGQWRVQSEDIAVPDSAAFLRLTGPTPGHDQNPVTVTRLPGLLWKAHVEDSNPGTETAPAPGQSSTES